MVGSSGIGLVGVSLPLTILEGRKTGVVLEEVKGTTETHKRRRRVLGNGGRVEKSSNSPSQTSNGSVVDPRDPVSFREVDEQGPRSFLGLKVSLLFWMSSLTFIIRFLPRFGLCLRR